MQSLYDAEILGFHNSEDDSSFNFVFYIYICGYERGFAPTVTLQFILTLFLSLVIVVWTYLWTIVQEFEMSSVSSSRWYSGNQVFPEH